MSNRLAPVIAVIFLSLVPSLLSKHLGMLETTSLILGIVLSLCALVGYLTGGLRKLWDWLKKKPTQGAAVITKDRVIMYQPDAQFISEEDAHRAVANSVRNSVRAQGRRIRGEPNITSSKLERQEETWYVTGNYLWDTGALQTVGFEAMVHARTRSVSLTFDS